MIAQNLSDNDRADALEMALIGLLADILDHWDGDERDLDVAAEDLMDRFDLRAAVKLHRGQE